MSTPGPDTGALPDPSEYFGIDERRLMNAEVSVSVGGERGTPDVTLEVELFDGPTESFPLPDRFFDGSGPSIDEEGLARWLGIETHGVPMSPVPLTFGPPSPVGLTDEPEPGDGADDGAGEAWRLVRPGDGFVAPVERMSLGRFPGYEANEAMMAGVEGGAVAGAVATDAGAGGAGPDTPEVDGAEATTPEAFDAAVATHDEQSAWGCLSWLAGWWGIAAVVGALLLGALAYVAFDGSDGGGDTDTEGAVPPAGQEEESAEDLLRRATEALIEAGQSAVYDQELLIDNPAGVTTVTAEGEVDLAAGDAQAIVEAEGSSLDTYLSDMVYRFDNGAGWVEAAPGELATDEEVTELGLGNLGIGEPMSPVASAYLAHAAEDVVELYAGEYQGTAVLPVTGAGEVHVDNWARSVYGRPQDELAGLGVELELRPVISDDEFITIEITTKVVFDDAIPFLVDDPEAEQLEGITLTNRTDYTLQAEPVVLPARDVQAQSLSSFLDQYR